MPPRKRAAPKPPTHLPLRAALEADLLALELEDHRALVELARVLADELDRPRMTCPECSGVEGPVPAVVLRYAEALEALGIGRIREQEPADGFSLLLSSVNGRRS